MMLVAGPVAPIPPRPYRRPLRVQTIKAEIRPTKASRITNIRIISRSSFPLQVKARPAAGLSHLKLRLPRARTCPVTFHGKLMNSAAAGESSLFILDANAVARNHGLMAKTVPYPADPPTEVVPKSTPSELKVKPAHGIAPSPSRPEKLCRTVSVHGPPGSEGGVNCKTVHAQEPVLSPSRKANV
jgi:hypothetical protein